MAQWRTIVDSLAEKRNSAPGMPEAVSMALGGVSWATRSWDAATSRNYFHPVIMNCSEVFPVQRVHS
jgi:hypothetical protein